MAIDSTDKDGKSFEYRLKEVSDEEIITILRFREHYQQHVVKEAIKEALLRGIISSIEDLEKDEFKPQQLPAKSLFPISYSESQNLDLFKSISRILYLFSAMPVAYGIYISTQHQFLIGSFSFLIGLIAIFVVWKVAKTKKIFFAQVLLLFNIPAIIFTFYSLSKSDDLSRMSIFTTILFIITLLYCSIYILKLTTYLNKNN